MRGGYQTWPNGPARPGTAWVKRARTPLALSPIEAARLGVDLCAFTPEPLLPPALHRLAAVPRNTLSSSPDQILRPPARPPELVAATLLLQSHQKEKMLYKIHSHAQIQDLQARSDELGHSNKSMLVGLLSLESVRIASESYELLWPLIKQSMSWACPELASLSVVAGLSVEIQKLEHDVLPQLMVQEAKLERGGKRERPAKVTMQHRTRYPSSAVERGALEALLLMKSSAIKLLHMRKCFKEALGVLLDEEDLVSAKVEKLSIALKNISFHVLEAHGNMAWLEEHLPWLVQLVTDVLETPVRFCQPHEYSDE